MPTYTGDLIAVAMPGGPFVYIVKRNGKPVGGDDDAANITAAFDGMRNTIVAAIGSEIIETITVTVETRLGS